MTLYKCKCGNEEEIGKPAWIWNPETEECEPIEETFECNDEVLTTYIEENIPEYGGSIFVFCSTTDLVTSLIKASNKKAVFRRLLCFSFIF